MYVLYTGLQVQVQADDVCGHKCTAMNRIGTPAHRQKHNYLQYRLSTVWAVTYCSVMGESDVMVS